uniref:Putative LOC100002286 [Danio rerio] n=1 Tax=Lepeophtheirus salmonis TaxID=72036 RepID=A0A0K2UTE1_LEPSM
MHCLGKVQPLSGRRRSRSVLIILKMQTLMHYDPSQPLVLSTYAPPVGIEAVLSQREDEMERPVAFAPRKLTSAELNYSQNDKEVTGIIYCL